MFEVLGLGLFEMYPIIIDTISFLFRTHIFLTFAKREKKEATKLLNSSYKATCNL